MAIASQVSKYPSMERKYFCSHAYEDTYPYVPMYIRYFY